MTARQYISVNTSYTRSINIERDFKGEDAVSAYIPTSRSIQTLGRIAETFGKSATPRAWALIGPYGAGKSAFGLFLSCLLSKRSEARARHAQLVLDNANPELAKLYSKHLTGSHGYCVITLTGSPDPLVKRLARAMVIGATTFFEGRPGPKPQVLKKLQAVQDDNELSVATIKDHLTELQQAVAAANGTGVLILIDELGKFLEYEARHRQSVDIFLLQQLAEEAAAESPAPLYVVVLLHQAFEQYFSSLGDKLKNEWKKVQGRFESIPFIETSEQVLRVVKAAIRSELPAKIKKTIKSEVAPIAEILAAGNALPRGMDVANATNLFADSYPLHPVSLLLLPTLCQRVAQNERTLFSYLGSDEPYGFSNSLLRLRVDHGAVDWVLPWEIYEYFILNQPGLIADQITHRRWAEVVTAVERLGDAPESVIRLLKTIGVLNIVGAQSGLKASKELLELCFNADLSSEQTNFEGVLQELLEKSVITYRRFNSEYRVWQGSDFDLDAALAEQKEQIGKIELAKLLNERAVTPPLLARRYSIESGTSRYFQSVFVDSVEAFRAIQPVEPTIMFCLSENTEVQFQFEEAVKEVALSTLVTSIVADANRIRAAVTEVLAFARIQRHYSDVANDPIAMRELKDRAAQASEQESDILSALIEDPQDASWWFAGARVAVRSKRELQELLSQAIEATFYRSPKLNNELINRDKPSATAIAARNKLLTAMLQNATEADLGFEKFPAEKAMYRSILRATGVHAEKDGAWYFKEPANNDTNLIPAWNAILEYLDRTETLPQPLVGLFEVLAKPPYGIKAGVLPILLVAVLQAYNEEIAIYDNGYYCPFLSQELVERIVKDPKPFSIQRFKIDHIRQHLYRTYIQAVGSEPPQQVNLIAAAKPLARLMMSLPDYTRKTKSISDGAQILRDRFFASRSPLQLLYFQIPEALGFKPFVGSSINEATLNDFGNKLRNAILEMRLAYHALLRTFEDQIRDTFHLSPSYGIVQIREALLRYSGLQEYTIDVQGLKAFIGRLTDTYGDESQWLTSLGSFLGRKPPEKWSDEDAIAVEYRLVEFAKKVRDLEILRLQSDAHKKRKTTDLEFILLKTLSPHKGERDIFVALDGDKRKAISEVKEKVQNLLAKLPDQELGKAVLAVVLDELASQQGRPADDNTALAKKDSKK